MEIYLLPLGIGSKYDMFLNPLTDEIKYQACICDNCFEKKKHLARLVKVTHKTEWLEINDD